MKTQHTFAAIMLLFAFGFGISSVFAQSTAFTHEGRLAAIGAPTVSCRKNEP
jgi:hypothetical protein